MAIEGCTHVALQLEDDLDGAVLLLLEDVVGVGRLIHPAGCQVLFGPLRSALLLLGVGQLLDPVRLRTLGVGVGAPCLSIVEL